MKLIHVALFIEAKPFIELFNLKQYDTKPFKIFKNDDFVLIVSGLGKQNTLKALELIFENHQITQAFNIGTAGCSDRSILLESLFCTNRDDTILDYLPCTTVDTPQTSTQEKPMLYDMEAYYFLEVSEQYLQEQNIYVLKIVSDHCDDSVFKKEIVYNMIKRNIQKIQEVINASE